MFYLVHCIEHKSIVCASILRTMNAKFELQKYFLKSNEFFENKMDISIKILKLT